MKRYTLLIAFLGLTPILQACTPSNATDNDHHVIMAKDVRHHIPECNDVSDVATIKCFEELERNLQRAVATNKVAGW